MSQKKVFYPVVLGDFSTAIPCPGLAGRARLDYRSAWGSLLAFLSSVLVLCTTTLTSAHLVSAVLPHSRTRSRQDGQPDVSVDSTLLLQARLPHATVPSQLWTDATDDLDNPRRRRRGPHHHERHGHHRYQLRWNRVRLRSRRHRVSPSGPGPRTEPSVDGLLDAVGY